MSAAALPGDSQNAFWKSDGAARFTSRFQARSLGLTPGLYATTAYEAAWLAFYIADRSLPTSQMPLPPEYFDSHGRLSSTNLYLYEFLGGNFQLIDVVVHEIMQ